MMKTTMLYQSKTRTQKMYGHRMSILQQGRTSLLQDHVFGFYSFLILCGHVRKEFYRVVNIGECSFMRACGSSGCDSMSSWPRKRKVNSVSLHALSNAALRRQRTNFRISRKPWPPKTIWRLWSAEWTKSLPPSFVVLIRSCKYSSTNTQAGSRSWRGRFSSSPYFKFLQRWPGEPDLHFYPVKMLGIRALARISQGVLPTSYLHVIF